MCAFIWSPIVQIFRWISK